MIGAGGVHLPGGLNHLNGTQALAYVRQRHSLLRADFDRVRGPQNLIRMITSKVAASVPVAHPVQMHQLLSALTRAATVGATGLFSRPA